MYSMLPQDLHGVPALLFHTKFPMRDIRTRVTASSVCDWKIIHFPTYIVTVIQKFEFVTDCHIFGCDKQRIRKFLCHATRVICNLYATLVTDCNVVKLTDRVT
jgi:hypothetical protein